MSVIYKPHVCDTPRANTPGKCDIDGIPLYDEGTIWECEACGKHWRYLIGGSFWLGSWGRVRFWHLIAKRRIRKATR